MSIARVVEFVQGAWRKLPVEAAAVAMAAAGAVGMVHADRVVWFLRLLLGGLLLTPLAFAAHGLGRRRQALVLGVVAVSVLCALTASMSSVRDFDRAWFAVPYFLALLAAILVPFVANARRFTGFVRRFFEETTTWGLLLGAALAALAVIVLALNELFDLSIERAAFDAAVLISAGFVLVYLHRLLDTDDARPGKIPELWRRFATAIGAPFVCVMLAILVAYQISVVMRGELPRNMLSPMIMAAGFVGFLSTLILAAVQREVVGTETLTPADPHRWARTGSIRLVRAFPLVMLLLLPMAGWALWLRVDQYGFTPFRAVRGMGLFCLTTLSVLGTARWWRGRPSLTWEVPAVVIVFALATAFGPLSAIHLAIRSQSGLLARQLEASGVGRVVAAGPGAPRIGVSDAAYLELYEAIEELALLGGEPALRQVLSGAADRCAQQWKAGECLDGLGVHRPVVEAAVAPPPASRTEVTKRRFELAGGQLALFELSRFAHAATPAMVAIDRVTQLYLAADAVTLYVDGREVARASLRELTSPHDDGAARVIALVQRDGATVAQLAIQRVEMWKATPPDASEILEVVQLTGAIVWQR